MSRTLISRIRSYYDNLSKSDQAISDYLIANIDSAARLSIQEFAQKTHVSTATISRFSKKIGFNSFQELKLAIHATDSTRNDEFFSELSPTDDYKEILTKNFNGNISSLNSTLNLITNRELDQTMEILLQSLAHHLSSFSLLKEIHILYLFDMLFHSLQIYLILVFHLLSYNSCIYDIHI